MSWRDVLGAETPAPSNSNPSEQKPQNPQKGAHPGGFVDCVDIVPGNPETNPAPHACLADAARAAGMAPDTLSALLSDDDREDLAAGALSRAELIAYGRSVAGRWRRGLVLPDERELADAWLRNLSAPHKG